MAEDGSGGHRFILGLFWPGLAIAAVVACDLVWLAATPHRISERSIVLLSQLALFGGTLLTAGWLSRERARLSILLTGFAFILLAWPALRLLNHLTMTMPFPLADGDLSAWDAAIGFDWRAYLAFFDRFPGVLSAMDVVYDGLTPCSLILFVLLLLLPDPAEACGEMIRLFVFVAIACTVFGSAFPAQAAMAHYGLPSGTFDHFSPATGTYHLDALEALRSGSPQVFEMFHLQGLVTFPSFHTAMGVIAIWCARRSPWLFWPMLAVNLLMIASTPIYGSHYGVDVLAGAATSAAAIALDRRKRSWRRTCDEPVAAPAGAVSVV